MPTALITGSTSKIGILIAEHFAKLSWNIIAHYNSSEATKKFLVKSLSRYCDVKILKLNFQDITQKKIESIVNELPKIDLLINNAAIIQNDFAEDFCDATLKHHMKINFEAPVLLSKAMHNTYVKNNTKQQGNIINILDSSVYKKLPNNFFSYSISKSALAYTTKISANRFAPKIRINGIALGRVIRSKEQSKQYFEDAIKKTTLKQRVQITDILNTIKFLLSSNSITGSIITLDSGDTQDLQKASKL